MEIDWPKLIEEAINVEGSVGNVYNRFYEYSFMNQILLRLQGVTEPVATYKTWQGIGRQVLRGSKAKEIVRPITIQKKDDDGEVEYTARRFKMVKCIFALSDTEGDELPPVEVPEWNLDKALEALEIKRVPFQMLNGNVQGVSTGREIAVSPVAMYPLKTTFHETAHVVLKHTLPEAFKDYQKHRGPMEFQAEATAYLCMNELGAMTDDQAEVSRGYLQNWLHGAKPGDATIREVFKATDTILKAGRS